MSDHHAKIERYLVELATSLRRRGATSAGAVEEVRDHLLETAAAATRTGTDPAAACEASIARLGPAPAFAGRLIAASEGALTRVALPIAIACGMAIAWIDSRPNWDDAGISAGLLVTAGGALGILAPRRVWLWALGLGVWIPLHGIVVSHNYSAMIALGISFIGAYGGLGMRKLVTAVL